MAQDYSELKDRFLLGRAICVAVLLWVWFAVTWHSAFRGLGLSRPELSIRNNPYV